MSKCNVLLYDMIDTTLNTHIQTQLHNYLPPSNIDQIIYAYDSAKQPEQMPYDDHTYNVPKKMYISITSFEWLGIKKKENR